MKKIIGLAILTLALNTAQAQSKAKEEVKKDANAVGNKTAEIASKTKSTVVDQVYKDKEGPNGETIYIDNHGKYYWIDKKGKHQSITAMQLKDKK